MKRSTALTATVLAIMLWSLGSPGAATDEPAGALPSHPRLLRFPPSLWRPPAGSDHRFELAGGASAFLVPDRTLPLIDLVVVARAGADREPPDRRGLAELTARLLRRGGTRNLPPDAFDRRVDELGAIMRSQATPLYGAATLRITEDALDEGVELLLDMIETPGFDAERTRAIQRNMIAGLDRRGLDPIRVLDREWDWLLYGREHFAMKPLRRRDIEALTPADLASFHRAHWRPENLVFAVSGAVDRSRIEGLLAPRLAAWAARLPAAPPSTWPPAGPTAPPRQGLFHVAADIPQAKVALGHRAANTLPTVEERVALEVMAEILGGRGAISRLSGRLRSAEGLVYRVDLRVDPGDLWPADYRVFFDTLETNTPRAVRAALEEIDRLRGTPPHPDELAAAQRALISRQLQAFDTAEEAVGYLVQDWIVGRPEEYRQRYRELVQAVTPESVRATAERHLRPGELTVLTVGRWQALRGAVDADGMSELERLIGTRVRTLPARDPLSLEPLP